MAAGEHLHPGGGGRAGGRQHRHARHPSADEAGGLRPGSGVQQLQHGGQLQVSLETSNTFKIIVQIPTQYCQHGRVRDTGCRGCGGGPAAESPLPRRLGPDAAGHRARPHRADQAAGHQAAAPLQGGLPVSRGAPLHQVQLDVRIVNSDLAWFTITFQVPTIILFSCLHGP